MKLSKIFSYGIIAIVLGSSLSACCHRNRSFGLDYTQNAGLQF